MYHIAKILIQHIYCDTKQSPKSDLRWIKTPYKCFIYLISLPHKINL